MEGGYTISNLKITDNTHQHVGIFEYIEAPAKINNLLLKNVSISSTKAYVSPLGTPYSETSGKITIEKVGITGNVNGDSFVFGFIGMAKNGASASPSLTLNNCYARVNVNLTGQKAHAGGMTGSRNATVNATFCYWSGSNNATIRTGSIVPFVHADNNNNQNTIGSIKVQKSYYDKQKFPLSICASSSGRGLTTAQMKTQSSYVGWDFENTWYMGDSGYPELKFEK